MIGIYFSGTGNSKYALNTFLKEYDNNSKAYSIVDEELLKEINNHKEIVISYPVQYSTVPKILRDFIINNSNIWQNKKVFIIATMGLFSGDGAGVLGRLLKQYGAIITGGLHLKMPDSIADEKVLKRPKEKNTELIRNAELKIKNAVVSIKNGKPPRNGLSFLSRIIGFFGQRLWFGFKTKNYNKNIKIDKDKCIGCSLCANICPTNNIQIVNKKAISKDKCAMCYGCVNRCPKKAITLLGKSIIEQTTIEKYLG